MNFDDLYRLLRGARVQAQDIVDTVREPLLVLDEKLCVVAANRSFFEGFHAGRDEIIGRHFYELGDGQWGIPELRQLLEEVIPRTTAVEGYEVEHNMPRLGQRTLRLDARKMFHPDNNSTTLLLAIEDVTAGRREEQTKELLLDELQHRIKNLLTIVQALARQTATEGRSAERYRADLLGRLATLTRAHELAFEASATADLGELIWGTLAPYAAEPGRLLIEAGPAVTLVREQITPMCLILHELATNAVKHGALSSPPGQVRIGWQQDLPVTGGARRLIVRWTEQGGPAAGLPAVQGFGTRLIEFATTHELHGQTELIFATGGLQAEIAFPIR